MRKLTTESRTKVLVIRTDPSSLENIVNLLGVDKVEDYISAVFKVPQEVELMMYVFQKEHQVDICCLRHIKYMIEHHVSYDVVGRVRILNNDIFIETRCYE